MKRKSSVGSTASSQTTGAVKKVTRFQFPDEQKEE